MVRTSLGLKAGAVGAVLLILSFSLGCSKDRATPSADVEAPKPARTPDVVEAAAEPPPPGSSDSVVGAAAGASSLKAALLGLNRKDTNAAQVEDEAPPPKRRARRPAKATQPPDDLAFAPAAPAALSDVQFQEAVNSWRGMRTCLARNTLRGTDKSGAMKVAFKIRGDGSVSNCEVVETSNAVADTIAPCVLRSARRIRFPAFGGDEIEKEAKFVF